jgi:hypothetical protein
MAWDWGTIGSVVVGGLVSGGATLATAIRRETIVASREEKIRKAELKGIARAVDTELTRAWSYLETSVRRVEWWPSEVTWPQGGSADDVRSLGAALTNDEWSRLHLAIASLDALRWFCRIKHIDHGHPIEDARDLDWLTRLVAEFKAASEGLRAFAAR